MHAKWGALNFWNLPVMGDQTDEGIGQTKNGQFAPDVDHPFRQHETRESIFGIGFNKVIYAECLLW